MKKQYIKNPIPAEISEDGGASILFVNKQTVPLDGAIKEAVDGNYCTGQATLIRNFFFGLMLSMADGVRRDGHARQIANFLTVYPVFKGEVDLDRGYDPAKNKVMIRARLLNEMDLDITDWSFEDVTPGKRSFRLTSCTTGELDGASTEALTGNYCTGQKTLIRNFFFGLMQSMADGVRRDGHARQIANFLTVYPVLKGEIDLERG